MSARNLDVLMLANRTGLDVSVVITAHHEGRLAHRTLQSVRRSIGFATARGVKSEIVVVLDRPDEATRGYFQQQADLRLYEVDFGDTGPTRNFGVERAHGRYVNFLDADDLFSREWLWKAHQAADSVEYPAVWSPQLTVIFENENVVWRHLASTDPDFRPERLIDVCHWLPANLMRREIAQRVRFQECLPSSGFGSEDWHWHCELLAAGVAIEVVDGTSMFYRRRHGTRSEFHIRHHAVYRPTRLLDFAGLERFGIDLTRQLPDRTPSPSDQTAIDPVEERTAIEPAPDQTAIVPIPSRPRSAFKDFYRANVQPRLPEQVDTAMRRLYFGIFPMGIKHTARLLPGTIARTAKNQARRVGSVAKRTGKAPLPSPQPLPPEVTLPEPILAPVPEPEPPASLPDWLLDEWREIHAVEPLLFPSAEQLARTYRSLDVPQSAIGGAYLDICRRLGRPWPSHVFLVPWLTTGGADLTALNYVQTLHDQGWAGRIVVIATEDFDSPWAERLPSGVTFLPFGRLCPGLDHESRKRLLVRLLLQMRPQVIHNINSFLGYEAFQTHGKALSQISRLLGHVFCYDTTPEGRRVGYPVEHVPRCFDVLSALISDNQMLLDELHEIYHLDRRRLIAHYQPVKLKGSPTPRIATSKGPLKILWAGRLDRQKRVDLLNSIAAACADDDFEFHAYGGRVLDSTGPEPHGPHLEFHGPFDGFESLPTHEFDVFLYTSQWDGLPNVLQEAIAHGLAVVASSAGGVKELIKTGETGYLIEPFDDVRGFVAALRSIDADRAGAARLVRQGYVHLREQHSPEQFQRQMRETPGYLPVPRIRDAVDAAA
jgi:glycosyltransferase involved in cell wall biosynthesis